MAFKAPSTRRYGLNSFGEFLGLVARKEAKALQSIYGSVYKTALSLQGGTVGGYVVPQEYTAQILDTVEGYSWFLAGARKVRLTSETTLVPVFDATTAQSAGTAPYFGGMAFSWLGAQDGTALSETEPAFRQLELTAWALQGYTKISNQLREDAPALESALVDAFARALAWYEEYAFCQGTGLGQPLGVLNAPAAIKVGRTTPSHVQLADLAKMSAKLLPGGWNKNSDGQPSACWAVHPQALADFTGLQSGSTSQQWAVDAELRVHGLPVFPTDKVPALGSLGDVMLIDRALYTVGQRAELLLDASAHEPTAFPKNQTVYRMVARVDGRPRLDNPVTLADGTQTASGFVLLN